MHIWFPFIAAAYSCAPAAGRITRRTVTAWPVRPWTWDPAGMFKIEKGQIHCILAILEQVPCGMGLGWSSWEDQMSSRAR
jgi:hypothetical protein